MCQWGSHFKQRVWFVQGILQVVGKETSEQTGVMVLEKAGRSDQGQGSRDIKGELQ
jgi:hypothetical protein